MKRFSYRTRLFAILTLFALVPAMLLTAAVATAAWQALPDVSADEAWDRVARSGAASVEALRGAPLTTTQRDILQRHERELESSVTQARRLQFVASRFAFVGALFALFVLGILWLAASRVAGHLSRQLSRPIDEMVGWTGMIEQGTDLPAPAARGAPEFGVLRGRMQAMAVELASSRQRMREAERSIAFRETARRVAHELKNPLTPMQFAIAQLKHSSPAVAAEPLKVLEEETTRLERMAKSFAQFGRLPDGPRSSMDVGDLVASAAQSAVPPGVDLGVEVDPATPRVTGRFDALHRAVLNVVLNAVEACGPSPRIRVRARPEQLDGCSAVLIEVEDNGCGIAPDRIAGVFEPYVTDKVGGTGLGLAIAHQTVIDHNGRLSVDSIQGQGTTVRFTLPATPSTSS